MEYIVANGHSIYINGPLLKKVKTNHLTPGEVLPEGLFTEEQIQRLLKSGKIKPRGGDLESDGEKIPSVKADGSIGLADHKAAGPVGLWSVDPSKLQKKTLTELKVMVGEKDPDFDLASLVTPEDAIKLLSSEWHPKQPKHPPGPPPSAKK